MLRGKNFKTQIDKKLREFYYTTFEAFYKDASLWTMSEGFLLREQPIVFTRDLKKDWENIKKVVEKKKGGLVYSIENVCELLIKINKQNKEKNVKDISSPVCALVRNTGN